MYNAIPACVTYRVNNKVIWNVYRKTRAIDSQLEVTKNAELQADTLETIEPQPVSARDAAFLAANGNVNVGETIFRVFMKDADFLFDAFDYFLEMQSRTSPCGEDLGVVTGRFKILRGQEGLGLKRDDIFFIQRDL